MLRNHIVIWNIAFLICLFSLFCGCDKSDESRQKSETISKKITVKQGEAKQLGKQEVATSNAEIKAVIPGSEISAKKNVGVSESLEGTVSITAQNDEVADTDFYNPSGKIDPFIPLLMDEPVSTALLKKKKRLTPLTPLEKVELRRLKLTGTIRCPDGSSAMVKEIDGKGYIVKKGTLVGTNSGKVSKILKDRIIIEEEFENMSGKVVVHRKELKLQKPPGEY